MKVPQKPGVYCLKATDSKLIYIGSTNNLLKRRSVHFHQIKVQDTKKGCKSMIDAYHSGDFVTFEVIEICDNYLEREQYWLDFYKGQDTYKLINRFDADRNQSSIPQEFRDKMSSIRKEKWKDPVYRSNTLDRLKDVRPCFDKPVLYLQDNGDIIEEFTSATIAAETLGYSRISLAAAARGQFHGKFVYKGAIFIYKQLVLGKLDELLETHQELRAISSEAWEAIKSTMNVQRLTDEHSSNNSDTSVQQSTMKNELVDDIV